MPTPKRLRTSSTYKRIKKIWRSIRRYTMYMEYQYGIFGAEGQFKASVLATLPSTDGTWSHVQKRSKKLVNLGVLGEANDSEWGAPLFDQPKSKMNCIRFLSDFCNLNRQLKLIPYPIPKTRELLLNIERFKYASSINLNIGYYHICLSEDASNLCTIILPWVKYRYKLLSMGVSNSPKKFPREMSKMFRGFEFIRAYIDDLLIFTKGDLSDNLKKLEHTL